MDLTYEYVTTEFGALPNDWNVASIKELHPYITSGSRGWAEYYSEFGDAFVRITNMDRDCIYLHLSDLKFVKLPEHETEGRRTQLREGDVLISITADIGISAYVDPTVPSPAYINQHVALVRFDEEKLNSKYISYFLAGEAAQKRFTQGTDTGAKAGLSLSGVANTLLVLPTKDEQDSIANALSDIDALLAKLDQLIAKKSDVKKGVMQELLTGKRRLVGFAGTWKERRLGELANLHRENVVPNHYPQQEFVHFSLPAFDASKRAVIETGNDIGSNKFRLPMESILLAKLNPRIPRVWMPDVIPVNSVASTEWLVLTPKQGVDRAFLFTACSSPLFSRKMEDCANGTTGSHQRVSPWAAMQLPVLIPTDLVEQAEIAQVIADIEAEVEGLRAKRAKLTNIKRGMMQQLLTGKIRLV